MFAFRKHLRPRRAGMAVAIFAGLALGFGACDDPVTPLPREGAPDVLEFSYGGYFADSHEWEVRGDAVVYRRRAWGPDAPVDSVRVVPSAEEWRAFWAAAEDAGVGRWRQRYRAEDIVDGAGWGLRLQAEGLSIESQGSNAYPDRSGREHEGESTPEFRAFFDALGDLVGQ